MNGASLATRFVGGALTQESEEEGLNRGMILYVGTLLYSASALIKVNSKQQYK